MRKVRMPSFGKRELLSWIRPATWSKARMAHKLKHLQRSSLAELDLVHQPKSLRSSLSRTVIRQDGEEEKRGPKFTLYFKRKKNLSERKELVGLDDLKVFSNQMIL